MLEFFASLLIYPRLHQIIQLWQPLVVVVIVAVLAEKEVEDGPMAEIVLHVSTVVALITDLIVAGRSLGNPTGHRFLQRYRIHFQLLLSVHLQ